MKQKIRLMAMLWPILTILTIMCLYARAQRPEPSGPVLSGIVADTAGRPISGATVAVKGTSAKIVSGRDGRFSLRAPQQSGSLVISYLGHETIHEKFGDGNAGPYHFTLVPVDNLLEEVEVSTGYQTIPKERATGSFEVVENELLNHNTSTDILSRLEGITAGTNFIDNDGAVISGSPNTKILHIRGSSGFQANSRPLIVLDNFPYEGNINNINPNDIESITILKDAAASSVWGARAGGGVVVINTKKPSMDRPVSIDFNSSINLAAKPNVKYFPGLSTKEFIEVERFLFKNGHYDYRFSDTYSYPYISPVPELLNQYRNGLIDSMEMEWRISGLAGQDIRDDYGRYLYRPATRQQYGLSMKGGGSSVSYLFSAGHDRNSEHLIANGYERLTLRSSAEIKPLPGLLLGTALNFSTGKTSRNGGSTRLEYGLESPFPIPYLSLVEAEGKAKYTGMQFRQSFLDGLDRDIYLDWSRNPLDEVGRNEMTTFSRDLLLDMKANYTVSPSLDIGMSYQYLAATEMTNDLNREESYDVRQLVNTFTSVTGPQVNRAIPLGAQLRVFDNKSTAHQFRGQLNYGRSWSGVHRLNVFAAFEARQKDITMKSDQYYGYDENTLSFTYIDPVGTYPTFYGYNARIFYTAGFDDGHDRFVSYLMNVGYDYKGRYILTGSARKDASNMFGVKANRRGKPFWSMGAAWVISNEEEYGLSFMPFLKLRATYGFSGNVNNSVPAIPIITWQSPGSINMLPYVTSNTPPNPALRWEKVGTLNLGTDFRLFGNRVSGSFEYYVKRPKDLISAVPADPTSGFTNLSINYAELKTTGLDALINISPVSTPAVDWTGTLIFSKNTSKVIRNHNSYPKASTAMSVGAPLEGYETSPLFAYRFMGLDGATGAPVGYLNGKETIDYTALDAESGIGDLVYFGSRNPKYFGSFRNTLRIHSFTVSVNLIYKLGYFFRVRGLSYSNLYESNMGHADFSARWRNPGDEILTDVPAMYYPTNFRRESFYRLSEALVEKADHIRLQEITLNYAPSIGTRHFSSLRVFMNVNNVGIIWRANKRGLDPNLATTQSLPIPIQYTFGVNLTL